MLVLLTFDPDILGDTVGDAGTLYYGSYYGGLFATDVTFTETGVTAVTANPATTPGSRSGIAMRAPMSSPEDGYYYLFASATNCCNGALTGYSVFVGRSASPLARSWTAWATPSSMRRSEARRSSP